MKRDKVTRISAGAKPGTPGWIAETLRQIADEVEAGKIDAVAIAWTSSHLGRMGDWWEVVDNGKPENNTYAALLGACCVLRSDIEHEFLFAGQAPLSEGPEE